MKFTVIKESETRIRIMDERIKTKDPRATTFEYQPQLISTINNLDAVAMFVTPTGDGVDRINVMRFPVFREVGSDEELTNLILTHLSSRGFDIETFDVLVYDSNLGTDVMSAVAVQYGYYDEYAGISIEK